MTAQAERIKAYHRGFRQAEPASRSRIVALESFGLRYERVDDFNVIVEGRYQLNLALSYWRSIDDPACHGYLVSALAAEIKRNSRKPAAGRESIAQPADPDRAAELTIDPGCDAESAAGANSNCASLLPAVNPWP
jgi:hypothetical protein